MLDIIEDYLGTVNVFRGSDVSLGDLDYVDEATAEFLLYKFKRELKRLSQFLEIAKKSKMSIMISVYELLLITLGIFCIIPLSASLCKSIHRLLYNLIWK